MNEYKLIKAASIIQKRREKQAIAIPAALMQAFKNMPQAMRGVQGMAASAGKRLAATPFGQAAQPYLRKGVQFARQNPLIAGGIAGMGLGGAAGAAAAGPGNRGKGALTGAALGPLVGPAVSTMYRK